MVAYRLTVTNDTQLSLILNSFQRHIHIISYSTTWGVPPFTPLRGSRMHLPYDANLVSHENTRQRHEATYVHNHNRLSHLKPIEFKANPHSGGATIASKIGFTECLRMIRIDHIQCEVRCVPFLVSMHVICRFSDAKRAYYASLLIIITGRKRLTVGTIGACFRSESKKSIER